MDMSEKLYKQLVDSGEPLTAKELAKKAHCSDSYAIRLLAEAEQRGEVRSIGERPKRYVVAGTPADAAAPEQQTMTLLTSVPALGSSFRVVATRLLDEHTVDVELQNGTDQTVHMSVAV